MNIVPINVAIASPTPTGAAAGTGATLPAATYFYRVVAKMAVGPGGTVPGTTFGGVFNNVAGTEASTAVTLGQTLTITIPYTGGVTHYDVYIGTVTNTEVYLTTLQAAPNFAVTTLALSAPLTLGSTLYSAITATSVLPGNSFLPGGNAGALYSSALGGPFYNGPGGPGTPFIIGRGVVISNPTGAAITINYSPDGTTAMAAWFVTPGTAGFYDVSNLAGYGRNLLWGPSGGVNEGGLPPYLVASAAGAYVMAGP